MLRQHRLTLPLYNVSIVLVTAVASIKEVDFHVYNVAMNFLAFPPLQRAGKPPLHRALYSTSCSGPIAATCDGSLYYTYKRCATEPSVQCSRGKLLWS